VSLGQQRDQNMVERVRVDLDGPRYVVREPTRDVGVDVRLLRR
jgi:hypothetical protein